MSGFAIPVVVTFLVVIILSIVFKDKDKVDKGFTFNYYLIEEKLFERLFFFLLIFCYSF
ncbi:hypothetical protein [Oceanobacillus halophilus]|uniref:hypothetical protein n=1 Tax=Oceanobacillus halophilus TaxID=930130 RepID=UPI00131428FF|nr:hypothetical protein [Oceanobacillus halophilus]